MNLHEYQVKNLLKSCGIESPEFRIARSATEAKRAVEEMGIEEAVVKAQIHAGGRAKAGGVLMAKSRKEIEAAVEKLIGKRIVNRQTGPRGLVAECAIISRKVEIVREYYLGISLSRSSACPLFIASASGGTGVEERGHLLEMPLEEGSFCQYQLRRLARHLRWSGSVAEDGCRIARNLAACFLECDASMIELNPLALTASGQLLAIDAKMSIDDSALFRQKALAQQFDASQLTEQENEARRLGLTYVSMEGRIGCMINGAGLAMAVGDLIRMKGEAPANFLDIGGDASQEMAFDGLKIVLSDPNVKAVFINIFGGTADCEAIARGIEEAMREKNTTVPIVARLDGMRLEEAKRILSAARCAVFSPGDLEEAIEKTVDASRKERTWPF